MPYVRSLALLAALFALTSCGSGEPTTTPEHRAEIEAWHAEREASLRRPTGYLSIVELAWLAEGDNTVGAFEGADVRLPSGSAPAAVGVFTRTGALVSFTPAPGVAVTESDATPVTSTLELLSDAGGAATQLFIEGLTMWVIDRAGQIGVRVSDPKSPILAEFVGPTRFAIDGTWKKTARFEPHDAPLDLAVPNVLGSSYADTTYGDLVFEHEGDEVRLVATGDPAAGLFVIFGDATNGMATYGGGRFLSVPAPDSDGTTTIDFNRAYNPPCAFSPYTTCPMPPAGNVLDFAVTAGETLDA